MRGSFDGSECWEIRILELTDFSSARKISSKNYGFTATVTATGVLRTMVGGGGPAPIPNGIGSSIGIHPFGGIGRYSVFG